MKRRHGVLGGLVLVGALGAHAGMGDCEPPGEPPNVPDGAVAAEELLAEASGEVRNYVAETQEYLACLEARETSLGEDITDEQRADIVNTYNAAVESMQAVADNFNEQVRRYRERLDDN
ncbi:MAG: hypothetical protein EA417_02565 [Gammaproteobacteria bacterium]|nr:MAG: hypothetical protein EA417_02565 [Gammaproteobacteria bacterium]